MAAILTPPSPDREFPERFGVITPDDDNFNAAALSPFREHIRQSPLKSSPVSSGPPLSASSVFSTNSNGSVPLIPFSPTGENGQPRGPFDFTPMSMAKSPVTKSSVGQRRGHKYKHSSISHAIFQEPTPRAPIALPNSLPIPTFRECRRSMSREQKTRFWWSACHAVVAAYTLWSAEGSLAQTALSHLLLFDALGATLCVAVDVLGNFEVWRRSSIRHPFGLQRAEVLVGFATAVLLAFMGMDLISHNLQHILEGLGDHEPHFEHAHHAEQISARGADLVALLAIGSTAVSAAALKNHARIGRVMRLAYLDSPLLPKILTNPSHLLTITCSIALLILPLLPGEPYYTQADRAVSICVALAMCTIGGRLLLRLAPILLMSHAGASIAPVLRDIEADPAVTAIAEAKFWQAHYGLCMANLTLRVRGSEETLARLRERLTSLIKNRLGGGYGAGGQRWEVSAQLVAEKD